MDAVAAEVVRSAGTLLRPPGLTLAEAGAYVAAPRHPLDLPKNRALFWEDDEPTTFVLLLDGVIRASRISEDGMRQILTFFYPGEIVGLDPCRHVYTAETVTPCRVQRFRRAQPVYTASALAEAGAHWADVLARVLRLLSMMAHRPVVARVAWLLLELRDRLPPLSRDGAVRFDIPRADIADHLGTAVETVCRTLTDFRERGWIAMPTRHRLVVRDVGALRALAEASHPVRLGAAILKHGAAVAPTTADRGGDA